MVFKTFGIKGVDTGKHYYWAKGDAVITQDASEPPLEEGDQLIVKYYGEYEFMIHGDDEAAIAAQAAIEGSGTGLNEDVSDAPNITDITTAIELIIAELKYYTVHGRIFQFDTRVPAFRPGQLVTITYSRYGLNATEMLIEAVQARRSDMGWVYSIKAIQGPVIGGWSNLFKELSLIGQVYVKDVAIGNSAVLIILKQLAEYRNWIEGITVTPYTCPIPSATLYPSPTLYPC